MNLSIAAYPADAMASLTIRQLFDSAVQHHHAGRLREAEQLYRQILDRQPNHHNAIHQLGLIAHQIGRPNDAIVLFRQTLDLHPNFPEAHNNLGSVLRKLGRLDAAIIAYRQAIALRPDYPEAFNNLGNALKDNGQFAEAIAAFRKVITINPGFFIAHYNLANTLREHGALDEAIAAYRQSIALNPDFPEAHNNLGYALRETGQLDDAIASCRLAIALRPDLYGAHNNLGIALKAKGQFAQAADAFEREIAYRPDMAEAHHNLSFVLLMRGEFKRGWDEYEWRWKSRLLPAPARNFSQPQWDGSPFESGAVLIHAEQGFGDTIQFIRYLPLVAQRGLKIILECQPELHRLVRTLPGTYQIIAPGDPLPKFDFHCPLLSLPRIFGTDLTNIPSAVPYLSAEPAPTEQWKIKFPTPDGRLRVGLAWAGNPAFRGDQARSMSLDQFKPISAVPAVQLYSLQKGAAARQAVNRPDGFDLVDLTADLHDFADTAALIKNLDLVISVDTAVAHLAGALAKPVWVLIPFVPEFRWLLARTDSPWYPTMRLFRQPRLNDWSDVIHQVATALTDLARSRT